MGTHGKEIPFETQFLIVESNQGSDLEGDRCASSYVVFLPILEGDFRAVLQGNQSNELEICLESGMCSTTLDSELLRVSLRCVLCG